MNKNLQTIGIVALVALYVFTFVFTYTLVSRIDKESEEKALLPLESNKIEVYI